MQRPAHMLFRCCVDAMHVPPHTTLLPRSRNMVQSRLYAQVLFMCPAHATRHSQTSHACAVSVPSTYNTPRACHAYTLCMGQAHAMCHTFAMHMLCMCPAHTAHHARATHVLCMCHTHTTCMHVVRACCSVPCTHHALLTPTHVSCICPACISRHARATPCAIITRYHQAQVAHHMYPRPLTITIFIGCTSGAP